MQVKKILSFAFKLVIVGVSFYFIYRQIFYKEELEQIKAGFFGMFNSHTDYLGLLLVVGLMFVNWGIEALKWKLLIKPIENISFFIAFEAIFTGVTISIFTPNRIGEYAGRIFHLEDADLIKASLATVIGSIAQLLATVIFGLLGILYVYPTYFSSFIILGPFQYFFLVLITLVFLIFSVIVFINSYILTGIIKKIKFLGRFRKYGRIFSSYSKLELSNILLLSVARYLVYCSQFLILLHMFDVKMPIFAGTMMVFSTLYVLTLIPTISIAELGIRGSVSIFFFGLISGNSLGIITSSFALWLINLALPAVIGALFVFNLKFIRKNKHYFDE